MKKLLLIMMVLGATAGYSQEIRVPDDKREQYQKEKEQRPEVSAQDQKRMDEAAAKRKEAAERQRREQMAANPRGVSRANVYSIIQEISTPGKPGKEQVIVMIGSNAEQNMKNLDERTLERMKVSMQSIDFKTGLDALNHYTAAGWSLENTTVYSTNGQTVREYMIKF